MKNREVASAILRQLERNSDDLLQDLSAEIDRWEKEQDAQTSHAIETSKTLRKKWNRS